MEHIRLEDIRENLADLVARVEGGETVVFTRGGEPVARMVSVSDESGSDTPKQGGAIDFGRMERIADALPLQEEPAGNFMRRLRDDARY